MYLFRLVNRLNNLASINGILILEFIRKKNLFANYNVPA